MSIINVFVAPHTAGMLVQLIGTVRKRLAILELL